MNGFFSALGTRAADVPRRRPMYRGLVALVEAGLAKGALAQGERLPAERDLARALGVSRTTVVHAYRALESRGLVRGYVGRGTFVASAPEPDAAPFAWRGKVARVARRSVDSTVRDLMRLLSDPGVLSFAAGQPALDRFPIDAFRAALARALARPAAIWQNGPTEGVPACRAAIADRFGSRPESILVVSGAQQGLDLLSRCLLDPGDTVVVDRPTYLGAIHSFRTAGVRLMGWDSARADVDELDELLLRYRPKLIYFSPTFQNPTGLTLPLRVRREVLSVAARYRVPIVEDDAYRELSLGPAPPPSFAALDERQGLVIHLNTFSKTWAPGLRLGWIAASPAIIEELALVKQRADLHTQNLVQLVMADFLTTGTFDTHLADLRREHRRRRDAMVSALRRAIPAGTLHFAVPEGGLYIWARVAAGRADVVQQAAARDGVAIVTGAPFYIDGGGTQELRLCFTAQPPERAARAAAAIARGIQEAARRPVAAPMTMPLA